jgi:phosphate transport system substrate-binding protein
MKIRFDFKCFFFALVVSICLQACKQKAAKPIADDTFNSGKSTFVADESFAPIVGQEEYVFKSRNPAAQHFFVQNRKSGGEYAIK